MQRKGIPEHLKEVLLVSKYLTLYLVDSQPPSRFTFIDPLGNYFQVTIDRRVSCSCLPGNSDHCMHTFYVLAKIYRMSEQDPLIYQPEYSREQLEEIFRGDRARKEEKLGARVEREEIKVEKRPEEQSQIEVKKEGIRQEPMQRAPISNHPTLPKDKNKPQQRPPSKSTLHPTLTPPSSQILLPPPPKQQQYSQPKFQKGSVCSICYQPLQNQKPLLKCPSQCFNYFHIKCLKFWIDYQKKQELDASCPMCRAKLPENMGDIMKKEEAGFIKYYQSFELACRECGQDIMGKLFRCLLCKDCSTCEQCYFSWKHLSHDRYLMKKAKRAEWSVPEPRNQASMAKLEVSLKYVKQFRDQQEMKALFGQNYSKFLQANLRKETLLEYLLNSLTSVSKEIYKTYKKLDYEQKDIKCVLCKKGKVTEMRRLNCKHFADDKCLTFLLLNGERICPFDKTPFLQAFPTLALAITKK